MNGRCKNDPLDTAEEVCGICGDEFCSACVISTRIGKARRVCKTCAIEHSGLRTGQKSKVVSKRKVRKQKRGLASGGPDGPQNGFTFFNDPDSEFEYDLANARQAPASQITPVASEETNDSKKRKKRRGQAKAAKPAGNQTVEQRPAKTGAQSRRAKLTGRRKNNLVEAAMAGPAAVTEELVPEAPAPVPIPAEQVASTEPPESIAPAKSVAVDPPPPAADPPPPPAPAPPVATPSEPPHVSSTVSAAESSSPSAAELLSVLKADEAAAEASSATAAGLDPTNLDLQSSPFGNPFADNTEPNGQALDEQSVIGNQMPTRRSSDQTAPEEGRRRSPAVGTISGQGRQSRSTISDPFAAGVTPPEPAPVEPARAPTADPEPVLVSVSAEAESLPESATEPLQDSAQPISDKADTDSNGDWIPPLLRGMAPPSEREDTPLPQRRSVD